MSISLPNNKADKKARYNMLVKQGTISYMLAELLFVNYCRLYNRVNEQLAVNYLIKNFQKK